MYYCFKIRKKSGGYREIQAPDCDLLDIQKWIKNNILENIRTSEYAFGYKKKKSIVDNASIHIHKKYVLNIDLKDFFQSISYMKIYRIFKYIGYTCEVAHLLTKLCTNEKNILPQGSPASPIISNIVLLKLDKRLSKLALKYGAVYTRYVDDITFSSDMKVDYLIPTIRTIVEDEGYKVNEGKLRLMNSSQRQVVTGLIVNKKLSVNKKLIIEMQNAIYYCTKYSISEHLKKINCDKLFYKDHVYGIAYYIKMVDNDLGCKYLADLDSIDWFS